MYSLLRDLRVSVVQLLLFNGVDENPLRLEHLHSQTSEVSENFGSRRGRLSLSKPCRRPVEGPSYRPRRSGGWPRVKTSGSR